jgi:Zn finger protein HypA/HybF involved in hydrogenase expression
MAKKQSNLEQMTIICPGCGASRKIPKMSGEDRIQKHAHFTAVYLTERESIFLCPQCFKKAKRLAEELYKLVGKKPIYFLGLIKELWITDCN